MQSIRYPSPFLFYIITYFLVSLTLKPLVATPEASHSPMSHMILNDCKSMFIEGIYLEVWMGYLRWWIEEWILNTKTLSQHFLSPLCFGILRTKWLVPAQDGPFPYTLSHLRALQNCAFTFLNQFSFYFHI